MTDSPIPCARASATCPSCARASATSAGSCEPLRAVKRLAQFEHPAQPSLDPRLIEELAAGRYLAEGRNVVFLGPPGVGKTHLAIGQGVACAEMGHRVYFTTVQDLAAASPRRST
ncbi:MAG: ATP-binding protein [Verrucomicrobiota bacterium]